MWLPLASRTGGRPVDPQHGLRDDADPGPGGVDQDARGRDLAPALRVQDQRPDVLALGAGDAGAGADVGAALGGVERIERDQPGIVGPAVGIFEAVAEFPQQRLAGDMVGEIDAARLRQDFARAEPVVEEQPDPQHQRRARPRHRRQHEPHRPDQVRRHPQQHLALGQRLADQPERAVLEIAQPAMDQLGRGRRGAGAEVVLLEQQHAQAPAGGVARDAGAVDAAADDGEIVVGHRCPVIRVRSRMRGPRRRLKPAKPAAPAPCRTAPPRRRYRRSVRSGFSPIRPAARNCRRSCGSANRRHHGRARPYQKSVGPSSYEPLLPRL